MELQFLKLEQLKKNPGNRDIREHIVEQIKNGIKKRGYNPAAALSVKKINGDMVVADGNHRFDALTHLKYTKEIPCVVYEEDEANIYSISANGNEASGVMAPVDLFDKLGSVRAQKEQGLTHAVIAKNMGLTEDIIKKLSQVINDIVPNVLDTAKEHQKNRGTNKVPVGTFDFTERWFRDSGLYELSPVYQKALFDDFKSDKFKWKTNKVKTESAKYKRWMEFLNIADSELVNDDDYLKMQELIENNTFKNSVQLRDRIKAFNDKAKNKLICNDCLLALDDIETPCINLVITDPPYGVNYSSNRSQFEDHVAKEKIANDDDLSTALDLFDSVCKKLDEKTTTDAHFYFFTSWKVYPDFVGVVSKYFKVKNMIVWDKGNHGSGDLSGAWGNRHELIIFAIKGTRLVNKRIDDIIAISKVNSKVAIHPTQKPCDLIKKLLEVSAVEADVVCDPFMGSGSTIKAINECGGLSYIGIELDKAIFEKAKAFIGKNNA